MASNKLSALSAVSGSLTSDSLVYIADTQDSGSSYSSKKITVANLLSDVASTTDLGTFSGTTIDNNQSIKQALQALETALEAETAARGTAISNLVDGAPALLDTLNEIAAAINDDENFVTTITNLIDANETHIDNMATLTGVAKDSVNLGSFSGSTITADTTIKAALQDLETSLEESNADSDSLISLTGLAENATVFSPTGGDADFTGTTLNGVDYTIKSALQALGTKADTNASGITSEASTRASADTTLTNNLAETDANTDDLVTLSGVAENSTNLSTFTGSTISDNQTIKQALQLLETAVETKGATGANVNTLVGSTSADSEPANYLFLVVSTADGSIKAINKEFVETEGSP